MLSLQKLTFVFQSTVFAYKHRLRKFDLMTVVVKLTRY